MTQNTDGQISASAPSAETAVRAEDREPASNSEQYLASLWKEIIGLDEVELQSKFLDVGGNSLTLNVILNRIEKETGAALEPQQFFDPDRSSLFELAKELDVLLDGKPEP